MIEKIVLDYLNSNGFTAYMEEENDKPAEYILVEKTGGGKANHIKNAILAVQSFSTSLYKTAELNEKVKAVMDEIIKLDAVCSCELNSDYYYPDTVRKRYRYQAVFDVTYY